MQSFFADVVSRAVNKQSGLYRYKDSITLGLVAVVWVAAFVVTYLTGIPESAAVIAGTIGNFAALLVTRLSPGAITPSMAERLEVSAQDQPVTDDRGEHARPGNWLDQERHARAT